MQTSRDRILTTHVGSLPRPDSLLSLVRAKDRGEPYDRDAFDAEVRQAVLDVVARQVEIGLDTVNDGEMSKISYSTYLKDRLEGFDGVAEKGPAARDLLDFMDYARELVQRGGTERTMRRWKGISPI
jgi:5-methyltetrahydropteroyltriglutamate--homocysteine methyltransferase